jgi:hypothetical protein
MQFKGKNFGYHLALKVVMNKLNRLLILLCSLMFTKSSLADEFDVAVPEDSELNSFTVRVATNAGQFWRSYEYCTGVLIRKDLVITASHCIANLPYRTKHGNLPMVFIGASENIEQIYVKRVESIRMPQRLMSYDAYAYQSTEQQWTDYFTRIMGSLSDEVVVLHLDTPSVNTPVKILPSDMNVNLANGTFILPGFPSRAERITNSKGQSLPINIVNGRDCSLLEDLNLFADALITNCFMSPGNSGGPLLVKINDEVYLTGLNVLTSFIPDTTQILSVHANLNSDTIRPWLERIMSAE